MPLHSFSLTSGRRVTVYMPASVGVGARRRHPLLILHDGQNLFEPERAFASGQHWRVAETVDALISSRAMAPVVICGIDHAGSDRVRELTPTPGRDNGGGHVTGYLRVLVDELLPRIRREFPVRRDRASTGLGGSSLGGLATLVGALEYPDTFGRLLVMSPSVWWDRRVILRRILRQPAAFAGTKMWLDIGRHEGAKAVADVRQLRDVLQPRRTPRGANALDLRYVEDPDGDHYERSWAARLPDALKFLYGRARSRE